jgi:hypothetical protein
VRARALALEMASSSTTGVVNTRKSKRCAVMTKGTEAARKGRTLIKNSRVKDLLKRGPHRGFWRPALFYERCQFGRTLFWYLDARTHARTHIHTSQL